MLRIYNTFTRRKEIFRPRRGNAVRMFVCGPTVYDLPHIGHGRTYLIYDALARYLRLRGFSVTYLQNITDVDDKIIARAKHVNRLWKSVAQEFENAYLLDMARLGIASVDRFARATDYVPQIVKQVKTLLKKGYAYEIAGDGYYFDLKKFPRYGKLSHRTTLAAEDAVSRIDESVKKRNKGDFCLWKFSKSGPFDKARGGEPAWKTELGAGRPGWHIEDTAITEAVFGPQYDIHGGGIDLIFPHHESEIAQMEAISGKRPLAKYWVHTGHLTVRGQKMSKSLGNFITIRGLLDTWPSEVFRLLVFSTHYRPPIDYDADLLAQAAAALERIHEFLKRLNTAKTRINTERKRGRKEKAGVFIAETRKRFYGALDNDFDTPKALAAVFTLIRRLNPFVEQGGLSPKDAVAVKKFFEEVNGLFGILKKTDFQKTASQLPGEVRALVAKREKLRKEKRFADADAVRRKVVALGWTIEDTAEGPRVKRAR